MNTCTRYDWFFPKEEKDFLELLEMREKSGKREKKQYIRIFYSPDNSVKEIYKVEGFFLEDIDFFKKNSPSTLYLAEGLTDLQVGKNNHVLIFDRPSN